MLRLGLALALVGGLLGCAARSPQAWIQRGDEAAHRKAWLEAADHYARAAAVEPTVAVLLKLGRARYEQGDLSHSAEALQAALQKDPECAPCYAQLGLIAIDDQQYERAMTLLRNALRIDPGDVGARNNLGFIHLMARQPAEAYEAYLQALAFDPNDPVANINLARLCRDYLRDLECARTRFERYLKVHPGGSEAIEIRAWLQSQEDRFWKPAPTPASNSSSEPVQEAQAAIEAPETAAFYQDLAEELEGKAVLPLELELALKYARKAAALKPSPELVRLQARLLEKLGRKEEAQIIRAEAAGPPRP